MIIDIKNLSELEKNDLAHIIARASYSSTTRTEINQENEIILCTFEIHGVKQ